MNEEVAALALQMVPEIGPATAKRLIDKFGAASKVFSAGREDLLTVEGLGAKRAEFILGFRDWHYAEKTAEECGLKNIRLCGYGSRDYPELLSQIVDPPTVIYYKGNFSPHDKYAIAIVGSRVSTGYGRSAAQYLAEGLASLGITVVSGMARGIDSIAHMGAIRKRGRTIAVLGSGIDVVYPAESRDLYERIQGAGVVMSEFPIGSDPNRENFPRRNRIISGLCLGVIVVEAARGSGTIITAKAALEQGREVFAVPGNIDSMNSYGTNDLLKSGAKLITCPDDVVRELGHVLRGFIRTDRRKEIEITEEERQVCDILSLEPVHIDEITRRTGLSSSKVLGLLLNLELKSVVRQMEGKKFSLLQEGQRV